MSPAKPSTAEEEYFAKEEAEKKKKLAEQLHASKSEQERVRLKELHWMHCPKCGMELHTILFRGISIDKCFNCRGHWLDHGELEKLSGPENNTIERILHIFKS